jgi:hypothetical protein
MLDSFVATHSQLHPQCPRDRSGSGSTDLVVLPACELNRGVATAKLRREAMVDETPAASSTRPLDTSASLGNQPGWGPPGQRRTVPRRAGAAVLPPANQGLPDQTAGARQVQERGHPLPQTLPRTRSVRRAPASQDTLPTPHLTSIRASDRRCGLAVGASRTHRRVVCGLFDGLAHEPGVQPVRWTPGQVADAARWRQLLLKAVHLRARTCSLEHKFEVSCKSHRQPTKQTAH